MNARVQFDAAKVRSVINNLVDRYPELQGDDELRLDMIEGETDLDKVLDQIIEGVQHDQSMAEAIKAREGEMSNRRRRYEQRVKAMRSLALELMDLAGTRKAERPLATLSIVKGRTSVEVVSVDELPQGFYHTERKAARPEIKSALEAGEIVPGACLKTGEPTLTIRSA